MSEELEKVTIRQEIAGEIYAVLDAHAKAHGIKTTTLIEKILRRFAVKKLHQMRMADSFLRRKGSERQRPADSGSSRHRTAIDDSYRQGTDNAWDEALRSLTGRGMFDDDDFDIDPADTLPRTGFNPDTE